MPRSPAPHSEPKRQAKQILPRLVALYPDPKCALEHRNAFELLVATILSAQCTDAMVNRVTPALFERFPDPRALAAAPLDEVESLIKSTGFFHNKAKNLIAMAAALVERHGGEVPQDLDALTELPGVGRKTAHVVLGNAFAIASGIVVDTHVKRLAFRLGLTSETDPVKIEHALVPLIPRSHWIDFSHRLIEHGRKVCDARKPRCSDCAIAVVCPRSGVESSA
ncbi:MAG: endonuclease III [Isosphaeraceae bacterium]|nr:endonuclease III [Isosphaeraceae bacterium]